MNIIFLGKCSDDKHFLLLCLAKIISCYKKVVIFTTMPYGFDKEEIYDYCGVEIHHIKRDDTLETLLQDEYINFIDTDDYIPVQTDCPVIAICEANRRNLEICVNLADKYAWATPSIELTIVYLNVLEYCKVNEKYLGLYWERNMPSFAKISSKYTFYFEEINRIIMIESQYSERISIKNLTSSFKANLADISRSILNVEKKESKKILKKAERMK